MSDSQHGARARERLEAARHAVERSLGPLVHPELAPEIAGILTGPWRNVLTLAALRHGTGSSQWRDALQIVQLLLDSNEVKPTAADIARLQSSLPQLARGLREGLDQVAVPLDEMEDLFGSLREYYRSQISEQYRQQLHMPSAASAGPVGAWQLARQASQINAPRRAQSGELQALKDEALADRLFALPLGTVFEFKTVDGGTVRAKLSWKSPITRRFLFVNNQGLRLCDKTAEELIDEIRSEESVILEGFTQP